MIMDQDQRNYIAIHQSSVRGFMDKAAWSIPYFSYFPSLPCWIWASKYEIH